MRKIIVFALAAFVGGAAEAQDYRGNYQYQGQQQEMRSGSSASQRQVQRFNRASNLIGADVRTRDAEKVGEVTDVVIDFQSGRVAYIVVDANDVFEGDESMIAVPAGAFRVTRDQDHVTIEADRERLGNLRSFSQNNLPAIRTPNRQMGSRMGMEMGPRMRDRQMGQRMQRQMERPDFYSRPESSSSYSRSYQDRSDDYSRQRQTRRNPYQDRSSQYQSSTSEDPSLYLYEWYVYDIEPDPGEYYTDQGEASGYGRFGTSQFGQDRYSRQDSPYSSQTRQEQTQAYRRQSQESGGQDRWQSLDSQDDQQQSQYSYDQDYNYDRQRRSRVGQGTGASTQSGQSQQSSRWSDDNRSNSSTSQQQNTRNFSGRIREIDWQNRSITVEGQERTMIFQLSENPTVKKSGQQNASFSDLEEGAWVQIGYRYQDGDNQAFSINETSPLDSW